MNIDIQCIRYIKEKTNKINRHTFLLGCKTLNIHLITSKYDSRCRYSKER